MEFLYRAVTAFGEKDKEEEAVVVAVVEVVETKELEGDVYIQVVLNVCIHTYTFIGVYFI